MKMYSSDLEIITKNFQFCFPTFSLYSIFIEDDRIIIKDACLGAEKKFINNSNLSCRI